MKKLLTLLAIGTMTFSTSADLTQFRWSGGTLLDQEGLTIDYGQATVFTILDDDVTPDIVSLVSAGQIDIADLQLFSPYSVNLTVGPYWEAGQLNTVYIQGDGSIAGQYAYVVVANGVFSSINEIGIGDSVGIAEYGYLIENLRPDPDMPPNLPQSFNPGAIETDTSFFQTSIAVIPEPSTIGLMGIASLGMFLARRRART